MTPATMSPTTHQFNALLQDHKHQEALIRQLRQELFLATVANTDQVWVWQAEGDNDLASLTCPIVIEPTVLRQMLATVNRAPTE